MIRRAFARIPRLLAAAMLLVDSARAGVWATDPVLGLAGDYATNPALHYGPHSAETHEALLLDSPTTYHGNGTSVSIQPSVRVTNSTGYSSLASDYAHLNVVGELDSERNTLTLSAQAARDSSLYYNYTVNGGTGVRRDTTGGEFTWLRALTERLNFNFDVSSNRVNYGPTNGITTLTDYRYSSAAPSLLWNMSERTILSLTGAVGLYDATSAGTKSVNSNLQVGFKRQLSETWLFNLSAGYSRESNQISQNVLLGYEFVDGFFIPVYAYETFKSTNNGSVYTGTLTRSWSLCTLTATASRSIVPTGFAYLARQDSYQLSFTYPRTERWTFDGHVRWLSSAEPQVRGPSYDYSYLDVGLSATWLVTQHWTLALRASRISAKYTPQTTDVGSTGVNLQLSRHFNTIEWH